MLLWEAATGSLFTCDTLYDDPVLDRDFAVGDPITFADTRAASRIAGEYGVAGHYQSFGRERMLELIDRILRTKRAQIQ
jgi:hypothetical protein